MIIISSISCDYFK